MGVPSAGFRRFGFETAPLDLVRKTFAVTRFQHRNCLKIRMREALPLDRPAMISEKTSKRAPASPGTDGPAVAEIYAYIAARNLLLREVEENTIEANLRRATAANDFAESCLRPARSPYEGQALPEAEAARERQHCKAVKVRLAELRARLGRRHRVA
jgi:hypothetical protein